MSQTFVYDPVAFRELAEDIDKLNNTASVGPDVFYLRTRYVPRALGEAADQIDTLAAELAALEQRNLELIRGGATYIDRAEKAEARVAALEAALQALANEFSILAARGVPAQINNAVLVEAVELLARTASETKDIQKSEGVDHGDKTRGMYEKFKVERTDGSSAPGGKHGRCKYFVLDLSCDPHAIPALLAYAESCKADYPLLARDLRQQAQRNCEHKWAETLHGPDTVGEHCIVCDVDRDYDYDDYE